ncbi:MAG TPA: AMP-binding protein [Ensifer sp.]|nr:AMP-binding protein [Ensifer sp.]
MTLTIPYYHKSVDWDRFMADYPPPPFYHQTVGRLSADALNALQEKRFLDRVAEAWEVPFYQRHWGAAGLEKGDITRLEHIDRIPTFTSDDLKGALQSAPPFGDHYRFGRPPFGEVPLKIQTSGGTTGLPRPTLFDPIAWEVQAVQAARAFHEQGAKPGDVVQITYTNSLANSAWMAYAALFNWMGCVPMTTGTGIVTTSERKLEYAREWGVDWWFARGEYLGRLAQVAEEMKFDLRQLKTRFLHSYLGPDIEGHFRAKLEAAWGCPVYDNYGTHEIGLIAFEGRERKGKHINEDTVYVQIVDTENGQPLGYGERGNLVATSLHRSVPPIIRYDLRDLMIMTDREESESGLISRKLSMFLGRADEMVKLRGNNVYPLACQNAVTKDDRTTGDYICVAYYVGEGLGRREEMTVKIERKSADVDSAALEADMRQALFKDLGVKVDVEIVDAGTLAEHTRLGRDKVRRLLDLRKAPK